MKHITIISLLFLFSTIYSVSFAQNCKSKIDQGIASFQNGELNDAVSLLSDVLNTCNLNDSIREIGEFYLYASYLELSEFGEVPLDRLEELLNKLKSLSFNSTGVVKTILGNLYVNKDITKAYKYKSDVVNELKKDIELSGNNWNSSDVNSYLYLLNDFCNFLLINTNYYEKALTCSEEQRHLALQIYGKNSIPYSDALKNTILSKSYLGFPYENIVHELYEIIKSNETIDKKYKYNLYKLLCNIYIRAKQFSTALVYAKELESVSSEFNEYEEAYLNLSDIYLNLQQYEQSIEVSEKLRLMYENQTLVNSPEYADILFKLYTLYNNTNSGIGKIKEYEQKILKIEFTNNNNKEFIKEVYIPFLFQKLTIYNAINSNVNHRNCLSELVDLLFNNELIDVYSPNVVNFVGTCLIPMDCYNLINVDNYLVQIEENLNNQQYSKFDSIMLFNGLAAGYKKIGNSHKENIIRKNLILLQLSLNNQDIRHYISDIEMYAFSYLKLGEAKKYELIYSSLLEYLKNKYPHDLSLYVRVSLQYANGLSCIDNIRCVNAFKNLFENKELENHIPLNFYDNFAESLVSIGDYDSAIKYVNILLDSNCSLKDSIEGLNVRVWANMLNRNMTNVRNDIEKIEEQTNNSLYQNSNTFKKFLLLAERDYEGFSSYLKDVLNEFSLNIDDAFFSLTEEDFNVYWKRKQNLLWAIPAFLFGYNGLVEHFSANHMYDILLNYKNLMLDYSGYSHKVFIKSYKNNSLNKNKSISINSYKDIQSKMSIDSYGIEFLEFLYKDNKKAYAAYLLKKDWDTSPMLFLGYKDSIDISNEKQIYEFVWKPIERYINPGDHIYFSPSGILHQIPIESLPIGDGKVMSDVYHMHRVSSTRELAMKKEKVKYEKAVLYGNLNYEMTDEEMITESQIQSDENEGFFVSRGLLDDSIRGYVWTKLGNTEREVEYISDLLNKNQVVTATYQHNKGNEESFKSLSGKGYNIIHLATHGFFYPDKVAKEKDYFKPTFMNTTSTYHPDFSMWRSGLVLSGGNRAWKGETIPDQVEDGILKAQEISDLDLRGADLVVLSACQTGLGEITSDGVFGLQRAFKMAGAQTIVMSLTEVDDQTTMAMMNKFYTNLFSGQSKHDAFYNAQRYIRSIKPDPKYWAGWIMLD